jgi:pimeloyl-[acyl-carrier protein] methyl ester esterase
MNINIKYYGQGRPLVFFHGWGFDSQIWVPIIPFLKDQYQIILIDLPGFGFTSMMDWELFKIKVLSLLPPKVDLIGWSLGGLYASRLAIEEPERVEHLINITTTPRFISDPVWPGIPQELIVNFHKNLAKDINKTLKEFIALQLNDNKLNFELGAKPTREGLEYGLRTLDSWDLREGIKNLNLPTCFMFGRLDRIIPVQTMHVMQVLYPNFKYVFFNKSAHMPFLSHTQLFISEILEFIQ